jgi:TolA-binding protein
MLAFLAGAAVVIAALYVGFRAGAPATPPAPAVTSGERAQETTAPEAPTTAPPPVEYAVATTPAPPPPATPPAPGAGATVPVAKPAPKPAASAAIPPAAAPGATPPVAPAVTDDPAAQLLKTAQAKIDQQLLDQGLDDLKRTVTSYASSASAPAAQLLIGQVYERQNRLDDAQAAYVELRSHYGSSAAAADATYLLAELVLRGKRPDREPAARALYGEVADRFPRSTRAPQALAKRAVLEDRAKLRMLDPDLQTSVPASLVTYRALVRAYPSNPAAEAAYDELAERYEDVKQYALAADALEQLATRFPMNRRDAAWRAGELYEDKVKDRARARSAYALVPATSPRYRDAQKKLR